MDTKTLTLTDFLLARITEDESAALEAMSYNDGDWRLGDGSVWDWATSRTIADIRDLTTVQHIARHDPARVLAECEAKRWLIDRFVLLGNSYGREVQGHLAAVYADHPDYRDEWRA